LLNDAEALLSNTGGGRDLWATTGEFVQIRSAGFAWLQDLPSGLSRRDSLGQRSESLLLHTGV
jgi:hypothetical protein